MKYFQLTSYGSILFLVLLLVTVAMPQTTTHSTTLTWTASTTPGVTYNVYYSTTQTGTYAKLNSAPISVATYVDTVNTSGYWEVSAVDSLGDESLKDGPVSIPNAPSALKAVAN